MKNGYIKVAATCTEVHVGNPQANATPIIERMKEGADSGVHLMVFPELCLTGYSCGDLFYSDSLIAGALTALEAVVSASKKLEPVYVVGLPLRYGCKLYNVAAVLQKGKLLGLVPKTYLPNHGEAGQSRHWSSGADLDGIDAEVNLFGQTVSLGTRLLFAHETLADYCFAVEIGEDATAVTSPATAHCAAGALIIAQPAAVTELVGVREYRQTLMKAGTARLLCGYVSACADAGESTQDVVYGRQHLICEAGTILAENEAFGPKHTLISEIDVSFLASERRRNTCYSMLPGYGYTVVPFAQEVAETPLTRSIEVNPFLPKCSEEQKKRAETILQIQTHGLMKRITHTRAKTAVLGISGGLDSALALLVAIRAMDMLGRPRTDVIAVTMPCFGTTTRTKGNAVSLCEELGVTLKEIDIKEAVYKHLTDLGHDPEIHDVTYENAQARTRTQLLMNLSNELNGFVVGTGDLSELALGWATYNGDHMSNYGVNASVPKTLVRHVVRYEAERIGGTAGKILLDIINTPVSPELLPADKDGKIAQKTEDLVGPYELHDFFLYYHVRCGFSPAKIYRLAKYAFDGEYDDETIARWLRTFLRRFTTQQFKRSCMPDGPKVGTVSLSPRGDWRMPSDAELIEVEL